MDPTAQNVGVGGVLFLAALGMLLKYRPWERKNGNGNGHALTEKRLKDLEDGLKEVKDKQHEIIMPALRWHDSEGVNKCKWERSESLRR
jgi:hypothetical protein